MGGFEHFWSQGDAITRTVAALLLLMSVSAWVVILWKGWLLRRVRKDIERAVPAFWAAPSLDTGREQLAAFDRERALLALLSAAVATPPGGTLEAKGHADSQLTRRLRDALHGVLAQLQFGQVLLASIGSTAPFIGLFGTVWGIYHALISISAAGSITIERVSGPVGEALVMTAAGLAVAIPAVLAYNIFGKMVGSCEAELEGDDHGQQQTSLKTMAFGRLQRSAGSTPMSDINMTPLIDVMLVLLVIFMITAPLMTSSLKLELPKTDGGQPNDAPQFISVALDPQGQLFFGEDALDAAAFEARVLEAAKKNPKTEVQLRADKGVPYGRVAELIALVQKAGLSRIGFVTEAPVAPTKP
jgi:biopolymer transport protein ExbB